MIELRTQFNRKGITFTLLFKDNTVVLYEATRESNGIIGKWFELFKYRIHPKTQFIDDDFEWFPSDETFGQWAWSCSNEQSVLRMVKKHFPFYDATNLIKSLSSEAASMGVLSHFSAKVDNLSTDTTKPAPRPNLSSTLEIEQIGGHPTRMLGSVVRMPQERTFIRIMEGSDFYVYSEGGVTAEYGNFEIILKRYAPKHPLDKNEAYTNIEVYPSSEEWGRTAWTFTQRKFLEKFIKKAPWRK